MTNAERVKAGNLMTWLTKLALMTTAGKEPITKAKIGQYTLALMNVPDHAIQTTDGKVNEASVIAIAGQCEYFPAYSVLKTTLESWIDETKPKALPPPVSSKLKQSLEEHLDTINNTDAYKAKRADWAATAKQDWSDPMIVRETVAKLTPDLKFRMALGRRLANLLRQHCPENLGYLPPEFLTQETR